MVAVGLFCAIIATACGGGDGAVAAVVVTNVVPSATAQLSPSPSATVSLEPQVIVSLPAPLVQTSETPTAEATQTPDMATPTIEESPTATEPPPTFTPPPPPPPVPGEHFRFARPVPPSGPVWTDKTYPYGSTRGGLLRPHTGVEFIVPEGTPVLAVAPGIVRVAGSDAADVVGPQPNFYGNVIVIELDDSVGGQSLFTLYGHLSEVQVEVGQRVTTGEVLGLSGSTGVADGPHLHFEVRQGANRYDSTRNPLLWLLPLGETGVVAGRITWQSGSKAEQVPIALVRLDAPSPYAATTSYAPGEPNADDVLGENFVLDDVIPGYYQVIVGDETRRVTTEMWVFPGRLNIIDIVMN